MNGTTEYQDRLDCEDEEEPSEPDVTDEALAIFEDDGVLTLDRLDID